MLNDEIESLIRKEFKILLKKCYTLDNLAILERFEPGFINDNMDNIIEEINELTSLHFEDIQNEINYILERIK